MKVLFLLLLLTVSCAGDTIVVCQDTEFEISVTNPAHQRAIIRYELGTPAHVNINVYSANTGRFIKNIVDESQLIGYHTEIWDGTNRYFTPVNSGMYVLEYEINYFATDSNVCTSGQKQFWFYR